MFREYFIKSMGYSPKQYTVSFISRVNIGFHAKEMQRIPFTKTHYEQLELTGSKKMQLARENEFCMNESQIAIGGTELGCAGICKLSQITCVEQ